MKKQWIFTTALASVSLFFSSCADPYYGSGYGAGPYPANGAEAIVPVVVGAALVGAILSNNSSSKCYRGSNYGGAYYGGGHHYRRPAPRCW
jgi:hypothetical protein